MYPQIQNENLFTTANYLNILGIDTTCKIVGTFVYIYISNIHVYITFFHKRAFLCSVENFTCLAFTNLAIQTSNVSFLFSSSFILSQTIPSILVHIYIMYTGYSQLLLQTPGCAMRGANKLFISICIYIYTKSTYHQTKHTVIVPYSLNLTYIYIYIALEIIFYMNPIMVNAWWMMSKSMWYNIPLLIFKYKKITVERKT